jgi:hypothetical protein
MNLFIYNNPFSASIVRVKNSPRELRTGKSIRLGQTVPTHYDYEVSFDETVPSGLPYNVILDILPIATSLHRWSRTIPDSPIHCSTWAIRLVHPAVDLRSWEVPDCLPAESCPIRDRHAAALRARFFASILDCRPTSAPEPT